MIKKNNLKKITFFIFFIVTIGILFSLLSFGCSFASKQPSYAKTGSLEFNYIEENLRFKSKNAKIQVTISPESIGYGNNIKIEHINQYEENVTYSKSIDEVTTDLFLLVTLLDEKKLSPISESKEKIVLKKTTAMNPIQFINLISFSISGKISESVGSAGTGWLAKKISDNEYYMITNWHVTSDWITYPKLDVKYTSLDYKYWSENENVNDISGKDFSFDKCEIIDSIWDINLHIDMTLLKIKFKNKNDLDPNTRSKLNEINTNFSNNQWLFETPTITNNYLSSDKKLFIGGYPYYPYESEKQQKPQWLYETTYVNNSKLIKEQHSINDERGNNTTNEYDFHIKNANLHHGSSGSIILSFNNITQKNELVGVYWGGYSYSNGKNWLYGAGAAINCEQYNIIDRINQL